jgi:FtsZ-binding cell division protein ZapB
MPRISYGPLYRQAEKGRVQLEAENTKLQQRITTLESEVNELREDYKNLDTEKDALQSDLETSKEQIRTMELSRFASAYDNQEKDYETQQIRWFSLSLWATAFLTASVLLSIFGPFLLKYTNPWYQEPGFYFLDVIFLTLFVYALKQHSHLGNLRIDYANRRTLAQSYQYIIEEEVEHAEIKAKFLERAANIFSSTALMHDGDVTIPEALMSKFLGRSSKGD